MIIPLLKQSLSEDEFQIVVRALRQNVILWRALEETDLFEKIKAQSKIGLSRWTPANLALTELGLADKFAMITNSNAHLEDEIKFKAATMLEKLLTPGFSLRPENELAASGLAALAIRERWMLLEQVEESFFEFIPENNQVWKTIICILIVIIPDQTELLTYLQKSEKESNQTLAIHAVMSQPISIDDQAKLIFSFLANQPALQRTQTIRKITQNYPILAKHLASKLLDHIEGTTFESKDTFQQLIHFVERTELLKITGRYEEVLPTLEQLNQTSARFQADLTAQLAQAAARGKDQKTALAAIEKISELENNIQDQNSAEITLAQINTGSLEQKNISKRLVNSQPEATFNLANILVNSKLAIKNGDVKNAQNYAHQVFDATLKLVSNVDSPSTQLAASITPDYLTTLMETLLSVNLSVEAVQIGQHIQQLFPNNPEIIRLLASAYEQIGDTRNAIEYVQIAHALSPEDKEIHKKLIYLLTTDDQWPEARKEAEKIIQNSENPTSEDYAILANCYLKTDQISDAVSVCEKGLTQNPDYWQLHQLLGKIYQQEQDYSAAQNHYSNAIIIEPQAVQPWLELAEVHKLINEHQKAIEKLLSASDVIPNNPEIHLHLGNLYLESKDSIKALASLNQAARFVTKDTSSEVKRQIDFQLGNTFFQSGYIEEGIAVLEKSFKDYPNDPELAFLYAQALIKANKFEEAFTPLTITIQSDQPSSEALLEYARLLLELSKSPELALEYINQVLENDPHNQLAIILLARATAATDDHHEAIKLYQEAFQTELSRQPEFFTMLSTGIADSAFKTDQADVAITFLQEALRQMPDNLLLKQKLCQAYTQANLKPDALNLLLEIKDKNNQSLENQIWIADQAIALKELDLAIQTLDQASQTDPQNAEIIVRLGYVQLENNQEDLARATFGNLFSAENVDITDMKMAAHALLGLGDISSSIPYLEKALELCDYQSSDLLNELTKLHLKSGHYVAALDTIQKHLQIEEKSPELWLLKSEILNKVGRPKAAIESISHAVELAPNSAELHSTAAAMLRENQGLKASLDHIQKALQFDPVNHQLKLQAAEIFHACLRDELAVEIIKGMEDKNENLSWNLIKAEILAETCEIENLVAAKKSIEYAIEDDSANPKALAIQAKILALLGKEKQANQIFENALLNYSSVINDCLDKQTKSSIQLSIGEAALSLNFWDIAIFMGREAEKSTPREPRPHLFLTKTYTLRAEFQLACTATRTFTHAPGQVALNTHAQKSFEESLNSVLDLTPDPKNTSLIKKWEQRGKYALSNQTPEANPILFDSDDFASLIAAWRRSGEKIKTYNVKEEWLDDSAVKFQLSLTYAKSQIHNAENIASEIIQVKSPSPIYLANHALMANRTGNLDQAYQSILQALNIWPDEPRWHALAAELENKRGNFSKGIDHLEQACALEKDNPNHHYCLGQAYLSDNLPGNAIRALQNATSLNPIDPNYWIALAKALSEVSEYDQAMISVEKAIKLSPNNVTPFLMAAEIAYANQETKQGDHFIQEALKMNPTSPEDINSITRILVNRNKSKEALQVLDNLINHAISPVPLLLQKADLLGQVKGVQEKIKLLVQLALENPKNPEVLSQLSTAYIENKQPTEAIRAAQFALKNGQSVLSQQEKSKLNYQLGVLYQQSGQLDQSLNHLSEAVKLIPKFLEAYLGLAETLRQRREYDRAFKYLEKAIEIAPKDPRAFLAAGLLLKDGKDYQGSESMLRKASALAPKDIFIQRQLAAVIALAIIHQTENA